jgi:hypothetical protein
METIGLIGFRKVVEDFAAVCKTIKQELATFDLSDDITAEVIKLGNQMDSELDALGETLKPLMEADAEDPEPASNVIEMPATADATGDARPLTVA